MRDSPDAVLATFLGALIEQILRQAKGDIVSRWSKRRQFYAA
jgi:hypothetical protein